MSTNKGLCFIIMSFAEDTRLREYYRYGVKKTVEDLGYRCERADEQEFNGSVYQRIIDNIKEARFVVADMTNERPNCYYELGIAHALGKEVIHITSNKNHIHFDVNDFNFIIYDGIGDLSERLTKRVQGTVNRLKRNILHVSSDLSRPMAVEKAELAKINDVSVSESDIQSVTTDNVEQADIILYSYHDIDTAAQVEGLLNTLKSTGTHKGLVIYCDGSMRIAGDVFALLSAYEGNKIANMANTLCDRLLEAVQSGKV